MAKRINLRYAKLKSTFDEFTRLKTLESVIRKDRINKPDGRKSSQEYYDNIRKRLQYLEDYLDKNLPE